MRRKRKHKKKKKQINYRINREITAPEVRLVGFEDNPELNGKVFSFEEAMRMAEEREKDLVEIVSTTDPPVCKIIEYSRFIYEQKKKEKEIKKKQHTIVVKEIRLGANTSEHDLEFKLKHAREFIEEGNKVKVWIHFRGRSILHTDRGKELLEQFVKELEDIAKVEVGPKMEGRRMFVILIPAKGKKAKPKKEEN